MVLQVSMLLCHPRNRDKFGLNAFEAHRLGKRIANIGFRVSELVNCTCIEVDPTDAQYETQLDFNRKLVAAAGGLLAEIRGTEKYLTLGGGHLTAFLEAVLELQSQLWLMPMVFWTSKSCCMEDATFEVC
jgi:hypothetical protein